MRKSQDIKVKVLEKVGAASCLSLLLLAFLLLAPVGCSAYAFDSAPDTGVSGSNAVDISFTPSSGSASLTPTTSAGVSAKVNISANIKIASTGGYTIYVGGKNAALTGNKTGQTIAAMSGSKTFANLDTNTWGFAYAEGSSVPDTATYSALPQGQGKSLASANGNQNNVNKTYALSFATKIGNDKPADMYSNQVTLSVISSPLQVSLSDISTMQEMTANHCSGTVEGFSKQLKDTRDGKYYWVSRLRDGKCWMTQNLDLDLSTSRILTSADSDVAASWTSNRATATVASSATTSTSIEPYSWDLGDYRILYPDQADNCGSGKSDAGRCPGQFSSYVTPTTNNGSEDAHYILGNHYNWLAATAGTGEQATSEATGSICPKGWRLPGREYFEGLLSAYSFIDTDWGSVAQMTNAPLYFVRGGEVRSSSLFANAGYSGTYWTPEGNIVDTGYASYLEVSGNGRLFVNSDYFYYGRSVRCVAR